ncbi:MAG: TPM domain-containing protein [Flavobacteriales bacterium]|nr:TPM domain-containing protein [Flavobacteriales bacterium]
MSNTLFSKEQQQKIVEAIKVAETNTSGEIKVHIEKRCKENVLEHAIHIFEKLKMHQTQQRNGVLFYLSVNDHKLAILGDEGINKKVPEDFWNEVRNHMIQCFKQEQFTQGLSEGIMMAGEQLKKHFPYKSQTDQNELSDEISFGGN